MNYGPEVIFGGFDGLTSAVGVTAGALVAGADAHTVLAVGFGLALASAVSMGSGEWLAAQPGPERAPRSFVMGLSTLVGSLTPVVGFILIGAPGAALLTAFAGVMVAVIRPEGWRQSIVRTFGLLAVASGLSVAVSASLGAA